MSGQVVSECIVVGNAGRIKLLTSGGPEAKRKELESQYSLQGHLLPTSCETSPLKSSTTSC